MSASHLRVLAFAAIALLAVAAFGQPTGPCTYTQGAYGGPGAPGQLYDANYLNVFPGGLTIGIDDDAGPRHDASWTGDATGRASLKTYFGGGGKSGALTADTTNATSTSGGTLAKQTATLTVNVVFNFAGLTGTPTFAGAQLCNLTAGTSIGSFKLTAAQAAALNGASVFTILVDADAALGGNGLPAYVSSFGSLNQLVTALNESFDNCNPSAFAIHLCQTGPTG